MEEEKYKKELFEFEKPKRAFPSLANLFPKAGFEGRLGVTLTLDKIIFIVIAAIMLMVIVYALGVERGKSLKARAMPTLSAAQAKAAPAVTTAALTGSAVIKIKQVPLEKVAPLTVPRPGTATLFQPAGRPFTIIAGAFTRKDTALQEAARLTKDGFDAKVFQANLYFQVCVGAYANKKAAQGTLKRIRVRYKDAYIKQR